VRQSITTSFLGDISGMGGLTKGGPGTLILDGTNSYTGLTSVNGLNAPGASHLLQSWQLTPQTVATHGQYYRLVTTMFLHENLLHIVMNMIALVMVGPYLERLLGPARYVSVYLVGGLGGSVAIFVLGSRFTPVVGASGAIFGLFGACLLVVRELGFDPWVLIANIVVNFAITFSIPGISKLGHLGGFVVGTLAGLVIAGWPQRRQRMPLRVQIGGLATILALLLVGVIWRAQALQAPATTRAAPASVLVAGRVGMPVAGPVPGPERLDQAQHLGRIGAQAVPAEHDE